MQKKRIFKNFKLVVPLKIELNIKLKTELKIATTKFWRPQLARCE